MTAASYIWPKPNLLSNGDLEGGSGTTFTDWTNSGTVAEIASGSGNNSSRALSLAKDAYVYQDRPFVTSSKRAIDQDRAMSLELYLKYISGATVDRLKVQVFLLSSTTIKYSWDFEAGSWVTATSASDMDLGKSWGLAFGTTATWTQYVLPKIYAPTEADSTLADAWIVRVRVLNDSSAATVIGVDDVLLSEYRGSTTVERVGRYAVAHNGIDYPVKYDHRTGTATELSITYPYQTPNSVIPTVTANTSGGSLTDSYYIGYAHSFLNDELGEESALPLGVDLNSGFIYQQNGASGSDINSNSIDFSVIELPNSENAKTTDSGEIGFHVIRRTLAFATQNEATSALAEGWLYFEGTVAVGGTFVSTKTNDDLQKGDLPTNAGESYIPRLPAPFMDASVTYRSRLFFAGSKQHRLGSITATQNSEKVVGVSPAVSGSPTLWGRWAEWMVFKVDGDNRTYDVERYAYTNDNGGGNAEELYLTEQYQPATASNAGYLLRPRSGRVYFTEEGKPYDYGGANYFTLDGDEGESVVALGTVGRNLLAMTRNMTYAFDYQSYPGDLGGLATPVARDIGCIAPKSFVEVRGVGYWLSDHGIVRSNGGNVEVIGNSLQDMFTDPDDSDYVTRSRSNQLAEAYVGHYPDEQQILMAVRTKNATQGCDVILAYNYFFDTWDFFRVRAGVTGFSESVADDGQPILLFTDGFGQVNKWGEGTVDGAGEVNKRGQIRGKVISATELGVVLSNQNSLFVGAGSADFSSGSLGLDGAFLKVTSATTGLVQYRRVFDNDAVSVRITKSWDTTPSADDYWELGGIDHLWKLKNSTISLPGRVKNLKAVNIYHKKEQEGSVVSVKYFPDFATVDSQTIAGNQVDAFRTGDDTHSQVRCHDTVGYIHRIELDASGAETPFECRFLECAFKAREEDR